MGAISNRNRSVSDKIPQSNRRKPTLEVCLNDLGNLPNIVAYALNSPVHIRIELCNHLDVGGTTPLEIFRSSTISENQDTLKYLEDINTMLGIRVMIRPYTPSSMGFVCTDEQFQSMKSHIRLMGDTNTMEAFVFGVLTDSNRIDVERCVELVGYASTFGVDCVFHRAFDQVDDKEEGLEQLIALGFTAVLTSGGPGDAVEEENLRVLTGMVNQARGRIEIIVGGGVRAKNLERLMGCGASAFHSSAMTEKALYVPDEKEVEAMAEIMSCYVE